MERVVDVREVMGEAALISGETEEAAESSLTRGNR